MIGYYLRSSGAGSASSVPADGATGKIAKCTRGVAAALFAATVLLALGAAKGGGGDEPGAPLEGSRPVVETEKIALGRLLFGDPRLSRSGRTSCATCHNLATNGATGMRIDRDDDGQPVRFNTPTVFNIRYNYRYNWEGRMRSLTSVVEMSILNTQSTGPTGPAIARLRRDRAITLRFQRAFGRKPEVGDAAVAIAAFLETLVTPDAPVDRWMLGKGRLTARQRRGYDRFKALGCASCHQGVNWGGNLLQASGVYRPLTDEAPRLLRVPSLRNVAVTAPYFHDGSAAKLEDAIARMGHSQLGVALSRQEIDDIAAFLEGLTGRYRGRPAVQAAQVPQ